MSQTITSPLDPKRRPRRQPPPRRLAYTFAEAGQASGLGQTSLWGMAGSGELEVVSVGRRKLITARSLEKRLGLTD